MENQATPKLLQAVSVPRTEYFSGTVGSRAGKLGFGIGWRRCEPYANGGADWDDLQVEFERIEGAVAETVRLDHFVARIDSSDRRLRAHGFALSDIADIPYRMRDSAVPPTNGARVALASKSTS